jgi:transposase-like protein
MIRCPACGHINTRVESLLGKLGRLTHYRCRFCGITFSGRAS